MSNRPVEDIQNRVRNYLGPIQTLSDICNILVNNEKDSKLWVQTFDLLKRLEVNSYVQNSIKKIIEVAHAADVKIDDKNFCVEDLMEELRNKN